MNHPHLFESLDLRQLLAFALVALFMLAFAAAPGLVSAGTSALFAGLNTEAQAAVFGPLGQTIIGIASAGGAIFALIKGAWLFAGLGIAVAGLMFGAQQVSSAAAFGALI